MQHISCITVGIVTHFAVMEFFQIRTWGWEIFAWGLLSTTGAFAYFYWCNRKSRSPPPLPPRQVRFPEANHERKGATKTLFRRKGGRQLSSSLRLNLSEQFRRCETPISPILQTPTQRPTREETENPFAAPSPVVHRVFVDETLSPEVLNMIKPFKGSSADDARDWEGGGLKISWGAYDWHVVDGCSLPLWEGWRAAFLKMFVKELTLEQWTHMVESRTRLPFETGLEYSLAKRRICMKCPVPLTPLQVIQRMVFGLNSPAYKAAVLSNNPTSVEYYFDLIRRLDEASLGEIEDQSASERGLAETLLPTEAGSASNRNTFVNNMGRLIEAESAKMYSLAFTPPPIIIVIIPPVGQVQAMIDTGACISTIDLNFAQQLHGSIHPWEGEPLVGFTEEEARPIGTTNVTVFFGNSVCNITVAVMLKSPFPVVLSKGWVDSAQPVFTYEDDKLTILPPPPPYKQFGRHLSTIAESPEEEEENLPHRGRLLRRHVRPSPDIRDEAPTRPRSIALLVSRDVVIPPHSVARVSGKLSSNESGDLVLQPFLYCGDEGEFVSPRCAVKIDGGKTEIEVTNIGRSPVLLRQGQELNSIDEGENVTIVALRDHTFQPPTTPAMEDNELGKSGRIQTRRSRDGAAEAGEKGVVQKFSQRNIGPFQIVRKLGPSTFEVEDLPSRRTATRWRVFNAHVAQMNRYVTKQGTDTESSSQASPEETDSSSSHSSARSLDEHFSSASDSSSNEESSSSHSPSVSSDSASNEESSSSHSPSVSSVSGPSPQRLSPSSDSSSSSSSFPSRNNASPEPRSSLDGLQSPSASGRSVSEAVPLSPTIPLGLGDLVWAYIPGYPLWPALITQDPVSSVHTKTKSVGRTKIRFFHVEFYADNGARSWLSAKMLFHFSGGVEELLAGNGEFCKHVQTKSKVFKSLHQAIRTQRKTGSSL
ncbi:Uncharacterized protein APZ42_025040 [Daphnia magna]|uniref:PWWP domain-containing protein n=1 Tax=Daphnia magna TaxID=35525 RepID=A0A164TIX2_9CRUS|nr:Uncharacterized protein APZ42_025040 [Daphnia magna]